jgi:hypothetical protein
VTPQSQFMIVTPVAREREPALRDLLSSMNVTPGEVDPHNALVPFARFEKLHFARFVIFDDATSIDLERFGLPRPKVPLYLVFMGDCDGPARELLAEMVRTCGDGLRRLYAQCEDLTEASDLLAWLVAHDAPVSVRYVNTRGRTVRRVREDTALQRVLSSCLSRSRSGLPLDDRQALRRDLLAEVAAKVAAGELKMTPIEPTPPAWWLTNALHLAGVPLIAIALLPAMIVLLPFALVLLRMHEMRDPEYCPRPDPEAVLKMQQIEDRDVTNSFTAVGVVKPGWFRLFVIRLVMVVLDYTARHIFNRGFLTRVQTIHFAHWVFIDDKQRVLFASNYDGSHESYMDDFINKVGWGLNVIFSNGFGWPHTDWLVLRGACREMQFKHFQRRHQVPNQVWYKAYPGLTLHDLERNQQIRAGVEARSLDDSATLAWLKLL